MRWLQLRSEGLSMACFAVLLHGDVENATVS